MGESPFTMCWDCWDEYEETGDLETYDADELGLDPEEEFDA